MLIVVVLLGVLGKWRQHVYYVSASTGADTITRTQAQSQFTPGAHLPGMKTATSNAAASPPLAGGGFILNGCDIWQKACMPITLNAWTGTSANYIIIDRDTTWYKMTACPSAWNRPILDAGRAVGWSSKADCPSGTCSSESSGTNLTTASWLPPKSTYPTVATEPNACSAQALNTVLTTVCSSRARPPSGAWGAGADKDAPANPAATPTFSPLPGTYYSPQTVTISGPSGATLYYTTDGTTPTTSSTPYSAPFTVTATNATKTVKAIAVEAGYAASATASATYGIYQEHANYPHIRTSQFTYGGKWDGDLRWMSEHLDVMNSGQFDVSRYYSVPPTNSSPGTYDTAYTDTTVASYGYYNWVIEAATLATPYWTNPEGLFLHHTMYDYHGGGAAANADMFDFVEKINPFQGTISEAPGVYKTGNATVNGALIYNGESYSDVSVCLYYGVGGTYPAGYNTICNSSALTVGRGNYLYLGYAEPFDTINVTITTANTGTAAWQYCSDTASMNGTCSTWSTLTVTDGTSGLTAKGVITFLPPGNSPNAGPSWQRAIISGAGVTSDCGPTTVRSCNPGWPANTTRPKFWVRALVSGGSVVLGNIKGDNWVSTATDPTTIANCGARGCNMRSWCGLGSSGYTISKENYKYNPSPGTVCTAKFEYQARMGLGGGTWQWEVNYLYPDSVTGRMMYPDYEEHKLASNLIYYNYPFPPNGVMFDDIAAYPPGLTPAETLSTTHMNDTDLYPCSLTQSCIAYSAHTNAYVQAWGQAYRPATGAGLYQLVASNQGVATPGFLQTCNGGTFVGGWNSCDVAWQEMSGVNYNSIEDLMKPSYQYYSIYDTVRDSPNPNNTLVGWYYPTRWIGRVGSPGPVTSGSLFSPLLVMDTSNRQPMFVLAMHYIMQPGTQTNGGTTAIFEPALGNNIYAFLDAYAKLAGSTTTTADVNATQNPPASGTYDPTVTISLTDGRQLGATGTFRANRDTPLGCVESGSTHCNRVVRICPTASVEGGTCDRDGELLMGYLSGNTFTIRPAGYHNYAIINSYPAGSTVQNFVHGSLSADIVAGCGEGVSSCPAAVNWHNVLYWDGLFPAVFYNIGVPDTPAVDPNWNTYPSWCGLNAGTSCPGGAMTNSVASCNKTVGRQYPNGCSPGDRDMLYKTGTAASTKSTCGGTYQNCAPVWRRDYFDASTGKKAVVLWRIDSANDWPSEPTTLGQPIDLQNASERLYGPYQELFADGTLGTPINSYTDGVTGHQMIRLRGTDGVILVQGELP
jgi:hypothetical protein